MLLVVPDVPDVSGVVDVAGGSTNFPATLLTNGWHDGFDARNCVHPSAVMAPFASTPDGLVAIQSCIADSQVEAETACAAGRGPV